MRTISSVCLVLMLSLLSCRAATVVAYRFSGEIASPIRGNAAGTEVALEITVSSEGVELRTDGSALYGNVSGQLVLGGQSYPLFFADMLLINDTTLNVPSPDGFLFAGGWELPAAYVGLNYFVPMDAFSSFSLPRSLDPGVAEMDLSYSVPPNPQDLPMGISEYTVVNLTGVTVTLIPEPGVNALLGGAAIAMMLRRRRAKRLRGSIPLCSSAISGSRMPVKASARGQVRKFEQV